MTWTLETFPLFQKLNVELQSNCNRECFFCPRSGDTSGKRRNADGSKVVRSLPTEHVLRIMDEAGALGFQGDMAFRHLSEAFLDPRLLDMVREARKRGFRPFEATNGDYLRRHPERCAEVAELYESVCVGIYDTCEPDEVAAEKAMWHERLKGTNLLFSEVTNVFWRNHIEADERMINTPKSFPNSACHFAQNQLLIHYDGTVAVCCNDMLTEYGLGNALDTPVKDLWYNQRRIDMANDLAAGKRNKYPLCAQCPAYPPTLDKRIFTVRTGASNGDIKKVFEKPYADAQELAARIAGKRVVIWGAPEQTAALLPQLRTHAPGLRISCFVPENGAQPNGLDLHVCEPIVLLADTPDVILVTSDNPQPVIDQAIELNTDGLEIAVG